jgi:hypothetical protein
MNISMYDVIGLMAPAMFLYAYLMVSIGRWSSSNVWFHLLNLLGALLIMVSLSHDFNLPVFVLEICWGAISIYGMVKAVKHKEASRASQP